MESWESAKGRYTKCGAGSLAGCGKVLLLDTEPSPEAPALLCPACRAKKAEVAVWAEQREAQLTSVPTGPARHFEGWPEFQAAIEAARLVFEALPTGRRPQGSFWSAPTGVSFEREGGDSSVWGAWFACVPENLAMPRLFGQRQ